MELFTNPIFISISTGVIVFFITWPINNFFSKIGNKNKHFERIKECNQKLLDDLKDYLISFHDIDSSIIEYLAKAESLEFDISRDELYKEEEIKALLFKMFIGIRLIPENQRKELLSKILSIGQNSIQVLPIESAQLSKESFDDSEEERKRINAQEKNRIMVTMTTIIMALCTTLLMIIISTKDTLGNSFIINTSLLDRIWPMIILLLGLEGLMLSLSGIISFKKNSRNIIKKDKDSDDKCDK